ncbi:putative glucose-6-phosphate 1-epimerase [Nymphaea colorata]|nr:putative glucose-6-phosphate 1-epimerase [Nymphaea colorata]
MGFSDNLRNILACESISECFEFRLNVALATGGNLVMMSRIRNVDVKPFSFTFAFHAYFSVSDISNVYLHQVINILILKMINANSNGHVPQFIFLEETFMKVNVGLSTQNGLANDIFAYQKRIEAERRLHEEGKRKSGDNMIPDLLYRRYTIEEIEKATQNFSESLKIGEGRIYLSTPNVIVVLDHEKKRTFVIRKEGLPDAVVWNPWEEKSKSMVDFGDNEYKQMLCVDGAAIEKPITLKPGEEWIDRLELSVAPLSYCF